MITHLKEGDQAPDFEGIIENGSKVKLSDYKGKKLVLYFYPKDATPTCTTEGCNIRDNFDLLKDRNIEVLGVSPDSKEKHVKFKNKHEFPFHLIADESLEIIKAYGVWGLKKFMGREYDGLHRTTFVIDEDGKLLQVIKKVKSKAHVEQILSLLDA